MQGKANFRGHPLHLILVSFPVAFWTGALATDALGYFRHDAFYLRMSVVLIAMGTLISVVAAICGYIDYRTVRLTPQARRVAVQHLWTSVAAMAVYGGAYFVRADAVASPLGIALSLLGSLVFLVGGYYGSELANRHRIGIIDAPTN